MKNTIEVLTKLIAIPSWVDANTNEAQVGEFIYDYLKQNSCLTITKQIVSGERFNVIAQNSDDIKTLVVGHMDTVQPSLSWTKNPTRPETDGDRLYGLGSSDMKSGLAVMLSQAVDPDLKPNTMFLFYIDEEYDFLGMRAFVDEYASKIKPDRIISLDGVDLKVGYGCRGLIEVTCTVRGKSGHAARPNNGINAITSSYSAIKQLFSWLDGFSDPELGKITYNLAYINGGLFQGQSNDILKLGRQGNVIPDICQFVLDIRPSVPEVTADKIIEVIRTELKPTGATLSDYQIRHNLGSWLTNQNDIPVDQIDPPFSQVSEIGYIDVQMLWQAFNRIPCFTIGCAEKSMSHMSDEYVSIAKVKQCNQILQRLLIR